MTQIALFDDTLDTFTPHTAPPLRPATRPPKPPAEIVEGWVKTCPRTGQSLPTLVRVNGDGNDYRAAKFALGPGATIGVYEVSRCRGVRDGKELVSMYEAVRRGLAWELGPIQIPIQETA